MKEYVAGFKALKIHMDSKKKDVSEFARENLTVSSFHNKVYCAFLSSQCVYNLKYYYLHGRLPQKKSQTDFLIGIN